jgi:hypothetical protein
LREARSKKLLSPQPSSAVSGSNGVAAVTKAVEVIERARLCGVRSRTDAPPVKPKKAMISVK